MKLIILDRDGVINQDSDDYIRSPEEWVAIPGSLDAIARLNQAGYQIVVCTNQSGLARGYFNIETLQAIHAKMLKQLAQHGGYIEAIFYCPHGPDEHCDCRKPKPGMLIEAGQRLKANLQETIMVGDTERDIQAAQAAGAQGVLVRTGKGEWTEKKLKTAVNVYADLAEFSKQLISRT